MAHEYVPPDQVPITDTNRLEETRTFWYDRGQGQIYAYNAVGRVFLELLGDYRPSDNQRDHLGFEIVDIAKEPPRQDVTIKLGELVTAYADALPDEGQDRQHHLPAHGVVRTLRHSRPTLASGARSSTSRWAWTPTATA